jgi:NagD protein
MKDLRDIKLFLLDMDGTIYLGDRVFDCTLPFLKLLWEQDKRFIFLTNNCIYSAEAYIERLTRLGIPTEPDGVFTSGEATTIYLNRIKPGARLYLLGTESVKKEFREAGFVLTDEDIDYAVLGFDIDLTYAKLRKLCDFVRSGVPFIATHPDYNCPTDGGFMPDVGSILALVKSSTGREPDYVVGKPNRGIIDALCEKYALSPDDIAVVGDRLYTDIAVGVNSGITSVLVLSGESTMEDLARSAVKPDYVVRDLGEITEMLN